jgi:hypothetical protein
MFRRLFLVTALLAACTTTARAQLAPPSHSPDSAHTYGQVISVSPVFALLGFYTGEVERRVTSNATIGVGGSAFSLGPLGYKSLDGKIRFYPGERALEGLSVGASAGRIWLSADEGGLFSSASQSSGIVVGTDASYTWLSGKRRNLALSLGGGFKRILRYDRYNVSSVHLTYPTARASVGVAF